MEVQSSFETKVTLTPEDLTLLANNKSRDGMAKKRDGYGSIDQVIEKKIKESYEGKCSRSGYVLPNSVKLLSRSVGMIEKGRFTGDILFYAEATCKVYQPPEGVILAGRVTHKNRMGIYVDYSDHAIRVMVPRDLHIGNEEFDSIDVGDLVKVEIKKSRYQVNDISILSVGVFKGRAQKPGYYGFEGKEEVEPVVAIGLAKRIEVPDEVPVEVEESVEEVPTPPATVVPRTVPKKTAKKSGVAVPTAVLSSSPSAPVPVAKTAAKTSKKAVVTVPPPAAPVKSKKKAPPPPPVALSSDTLADSNEEESD
jgi:DNA-directed RNA polymerase subunit E'/Rpb7